MAKALYLVSTNEISEKTAICLGLALKFRDLGLKVSYFKPIAPAIGSIRAGYPCDDDVQLMIESLHLPYSVTTAVAGFLERRYLDKVSVEQRNALLKRIDELYGEISKNSDLVMVEGARRLRDGTALGLDPTSLAKRFGAKMIVISKAGEDTVADKLIVAKKVMDLNQVDLLGCIISNVPKMMTERVRGVVKPMLESKHINVLGIIPEETSLTAPSVADIQSTLQGEVLAGEESFERIVRHIVVGAMTPSSAISFFEKVKDKVVVTGGDRTDIALLALETDTSLLVLTGNMYPDIHIISKAKEKKVPVILVGDDTFSTVNKIEAATVRIRPDDQKKVNFVKEIVSNYLDWEKILALLDLKFET